MKQVNMKSTGKARIVVIIFSFEQLQYYFQ